MSPTEIIAEQRPAGVDERIREPGVSPLRPDVRRCDARLGSLSTAENKAGAAALRRPPRLTRRGSQSAQVVQTLSNRTWTMSFGPGSK